MPGVRVREGESLEKAIKRFRRQCERSGVLSEVKKRAHYEKPSERKKRKAAQAKKRLLKRLRRIRQNRD